MNSRKPERKVGGENHTNRNQVEVTIKRTENNGAKEIQSMLPMLHGSP